jgi:hypothetical protein
MSSINRNNRISQLESKASIRDSTNSNSLSRTALSSLVSAVSFSQQQPRLPAELLMMIVDTLSKSGNMGTALELSVTNRSVSGFGLSILRSHRACVWVGLVSVFDGKATSESVIGLF